MLAAVYLRTKLDILRQQWHRGCLESKLKFNYSAGISFQWLYVFKKPGFMPVIIKFAITWNVNRLGWDTA